jgi:RNA polymerase sigma factor (sigma-70 family)
VPLDALPGVGREAGPRFAARALFVQGCWDFAGPASSSAGLLAAQSDQRLVDLVRRGHKRAFEVLVQRYRRPLLRYCGRMGLVDARAEDVLQQSLLQAWLALERGVEVRDPRPWLYRIVHNTAVNHVRSSREDLTLLADAPSTRTSSTAPESELERRSAVRDALTDVAALPRMQREAILLSAVAGQSHEEVASVLGVTNGAVRGLLYRARATLRAAAAAITPQPLINWACSTGGSGPAADRLAEVSASAGAAGMAGVLVKGAAVAVTAAVVVAGAAVTHRRSPAHRPNVAAVSAGIAPRGSERLSPVALTTIVSPSEAAASAVPSARGGGVRRNRSGSGARSRQVRSPGSPPALVQSQDGHGSGGHSEILDSERPASHSDSHANRLAAGGGDGSGSHPARAQQGDGETSSGAPSGSHQSAGSDGSGGSGRAAPTSTAAGDEAAQPAAVSIIAPAMPATVAHTSD